MGDEVAIKRQLTIKTGVVKRSVEYLALWRERQSGAHKAHCSALLSHSLTKETGMYAKEAQEQQSKLDKATVEGKDEWDVKNQVR